MNPDRHESGIRLSARKGISAISPKKVIQHTGCDWEAQTAEFTSAWLGVISTDEESCEVNHHSAAVTLIGMHVNHVIQNLHSSGWKEI